jgi:hypothetical protein
VSEATPLAWYWLFSKTEVLLDCYQRGTHYPRCPVVTLLWCKPWQSKRHTSIHFVQSRNCANLLSSLFICLFTHQPCCHCHCPRHCLCCCCHPCCCCLPIILIAIALASVAPSPFSSHATFVANVMAPAALALFSAHHPHCRHHCPCHPCPLCCCCHHLLHALVACCCPLSWLCSRRCSLTCRRPPLMLPSLVDCCQYLMLPNSSDSPAEGGRGTHRRARQITFIVGWAVRSQ